MANLKPKVLSNNGADKLLDDNDNLVLVKSPVDNTHGANKKYVDDTTTALGTLLDGKIADEETNRINGDNLLQNQIDAINNPGGGDPIYVRKAGDDMTGDLTIGTDQITLGINGSASFAESVTLGKFNDRAANGYTSLVSANKSGGGSAFTAANGDAGGYNWLAYNSDSSAITSSIESDGTAVFAGQVQTISLYSQYSIITSAQGANQGIFIGSSSTTAPTTENSNIHLKGDGSANFAGAIEAASIDGGTY